MKNYKLVNSTGSYDLNLPSDISEDTEATISSYWRTGESVLLQLSSNIRTQGDQVSALNRLKARLDRNSLANFNMEDVQAKNCPDCAAASVIDSEGIMWIYFYGVWQDLMIFATISGKPSEIKISGLWALDALRTLRRR